MFFFFLTSFLHVFTTNPGMSLTQGELGDSAGGVQPMNESF